MGEAPPPDKQSEAGTPGGWAGVFLQLISRRGSHGGQNRQDGLCPGAGLRLL